MLSATQTVPVARKAFWAGHVISALAIAFLIFDSAIKVLNLAPAVEATTQLGYPVSLAVYTIPRTAVLGAILMTGYLGGAIATQVRAGSPPFNIIFPVIIGALLWGGLFLREKRLRALVPLRS